MFEDGRMFKVFCANKKQKERFREVTWKKGLTVEIMENGIHNITQWELIIKSETI